MLKEKEIKRFKGEISENEEKIRSELIELFKKCPIPHEELLDNLGLFIKRKHLSRILFMNHLYEKIINTHGVIIEFGTRWGQNLALFESLRGMYEPFNHNRKIVAFDTFKGFPSVHDKDGKGELASAGYYNVTGNYFEYLDKLMQYHENESPIAHKKKYELVKGDATKTIYEYLDCHPETIIAFAYFDFDIYEPTYECLKAIKPHLTKGSIIGFDELNCNYYPGETVALREFFGLDKYAIRRTPFSSLQSYIVIE